MPTFAENLPQFDANKDFKDTNVGQGQWDAWTREEQGKQGGASAYNTKNKYTQEGGGCPPNLPYTSRPGPGGEVECAAKPDDCPEGSHVVGTPGKCVSNSEGQPGGGGGGAGGAGGAGGGLTQWNNPVYQKLQAEGLAGLSDPNVAMTNYLGGGGAAGQQAQMDAARKQIQLMPPGPQRDAALAGLNERQATGKVALGQEARQDSYAKAMGLTGLEQGYTQQDLSKYQGDQQIGLGYAQNDTSRYGIDQSTGLGYANLGENARQFGAQTDYNKWAQQGNWGQENKQLAQNQSQFKASQPKWWEKALGFLSDIRMKEHVELGGRGLETLKALPSYTYNYKGDVLPRTGVMAQDLEKVAPEMVHEVDGLKFVDGYGLITMTMNAVKELDTKMSKLRRRK